MSGKYDIFFFGHVADEIIKTPSEEYQMTAGPILFATWTAHQLGHSLGVLTKTSLKDRHLLSAFPVPEKEIIWRKSSNTVFNRLEYPTETMERRVVTNLKNADPYTIEDFPEVSAKLIHCCTFYHGEVDVTTIRFLSERALIAIDIQGFLRKVFPDHSVKYSDYKDKMELFALCRFLKADAAEAAFATGIDTASHGGRIRAAEQFLALGVKEVVLSHHEELLAATKSGVVSAPLVNRYTSGRTGRGDTCFVSYTTERFRKGPDDAIRFAAAATSMKLEHPGYFNKSRKEVEIFLAEHY